MERFAASYLQGHCTQSNELNKCCLHTSRPTHCIRKPVGSSIPFCRCMRYCLLNSSSMRCSRSTYVNAYHRVLQRNTALAHGQDFTKQMCCTIKMLQSMGNVSMPRRCESLTTISPTCEMISAWITMSLVFTDIACRLHIATRGPHLLPKIHLPNV